LVGRPEAGAEALEVGSFFPCTRTQAKALRGFARTRSNLPLELPHIAEEVANQGKEQRHALRSWTIRVFERLLLLDHSPAE
jgi:hypothetical protein